MLSWKASWEEHSLFNVLQMADSNNIEMEIVNKDVLLRSDAAAPAVASSAQNTQQVQPIQTTEGGAAQRQVRLTRRERDERTSSHHNQITSKSHRSSQHRHSSSTSRSRHHYRHDRQYSSSSRSRSHERTRQPESRSKYNCCLHPVLKRDITVICLHFRTLLQMWQAGACQKRMHQWVQKETPEDHNSIHF